MTDRASRSFDTGRAAFHNRSTPASARAVGRVAEAAASAGACEDPAMRPRATLLETRGFRNVLDMPPVENPIRLGVAGLGHRAVGNVLPKAMAYDDYRLAAVCEVREELLETVRADLRSRHGLDVPGYTDFDRMIAGEELDAVAVVIDPDKQVPLACRAMEAGLHVMMEVPTAYTIEDCWRLVTAVERTGRVFLLMEQSRYAGRVQAWRQIVQTGVIGKPVFVEGEYFGHKPDAYFQDARGRFYTPEQAARRPEARPAWRQLVPTITYLPHELSPLLYVIDDRVARVVGMSTRSPSYNYPNLNKADIQAALMHTEKDVVMRMAVGHSTAAFDRGGTNHWHHIKGTVGVLETRRAPYESDKLWVDGWHLEAPLAVPWSHKRTDAPPEAAGSGHGDMDYYTFAYFADAVLRGEPIEFDVYRAVETAAPAILAARSIEEGNVPLDVPDFRPGPHRKPGEPPRGVTL